MAEYSTITRRIEVCLHRHGDSDEAKQYMDEDRSAWTAINDNLYKAANLIVSHSFFNDAYLDRLRIQSPRFKEIKKQLHPSKIGKLDKDTIAELKAEQKNLNKVFRNERLRFLRGGDSEGKGSEQNSTFRVVSDEFLEVIPSNVLTCLNQNITSTYKKYRNEIESGGRTISNFRKGLPVPFSIKENGKLRLDTRADGSVFIKFPGGGKVRERAKYKPGMEWDLMFGRDRSNNREIVDRILNGQYDVGDSSIQKVKNKNFLLLVVKIPRQPSVGNPDRVVGIDLGLNIPLYAALNDSDYKRLSIGSRDHFLRIRQRMEAQRRELQSCLHDSTNGGRGRTHKLRALERLKDKERNWVHQQNHIFSRSAIEFARKNNAGVIHMERLTGFGRDENGDVKSDKKYFLGKWSYYELQQLIEYKALAVGIEVRYIDPYHTSQICSFCGHYEPGQRVDQSHFVCQNPECEQGKGEKLADGSYAGINADWNAARNIAKSDKIVDRKKKPFRPAKKEPTKPIGS